LGEIVHDVDLRDDKFHRLEAAGLSSIIDGLSETLRDDRKLMQQTDAIFDGLLAMLSKVKDAKPRRRKPAKVSRRK